MHVIFSFSLRLKTNVRMASVSTTQTALCVIPPNDVWEQIQAIRSVHDKAYPRWMPHINFIYPFVPEKSFDDIKARLEPVLNGLKPFQIEFDDSSFHYFEQKKNECTYHLRPKVTTDIVELQKIIQNQLSHLIKNKRAFEAHLTLGQTKLSKISDVFKEIKAKWKTIEFTVDRVYMISRENHPENLFTIKSEILLLDQEKESLSAATANLTMNPMKSIALNYLCILPPNGFFTRLIELFKNTSFRPYQSFRIILNEYESGSVDADLRSTIESMTKFALEFKSDSLGFDPTTSRVFLQPVDIELFRQSKLIDENKYDGTLTLGEIDQQDFDKINDRFTKNYSQNNIKFAIDRIHLTDSNGHFKFIFRLKS